jgi:lysophospholipase L1-like esterase
MPACSILRNSGVVGTSSADPAGMLEIGLRMPCSAPILRHFGLVRPYRFERFLLAVFAILLAVCAVAAAAWMRSTGQLAMSGPRGGYFVYLAILLALALALVRWPAVAAVVLTLTAVELAMGAGVAALQGPTAATLLPPLRTEPARFEWHPLLQAVPIPSVDFISRTGLAIRHTREGTRGRDPGGDLEGRTVVATFGGSTTYDVGVGDGDTWSDRLAEALNQGAETGPFFVVNHGVPGYTTAEHLLQTAFYQTRFGVSPRCAIYYVGWNDLRNAHIPNLDRGYADFHLPSQTDSLLTRRINHTYFTVSPLLTFVLRSMVPHVDSVRYSVDPYALPLASGSDPNLEDIYRQNIRAISAMNRARGITTIWVGQLLNRTWLAGESRYGWVPRLRDSDLWPVQQELNAVLEHAARDLGDVYVAMPVDDFANEDFVDQGHFSKRGARRFASALAPVVRQACRQAKIKVR